MTTGRSLRQGHPDLDGSSPPVTSPAGALGASIPFSVHQGEMLAKIFALGDPAAGVTQVIIPVRDGISVHGLTWAWRRVTLTHAALRSSVHVTECGGLVQVVNAHAGRIERIEEDRGLASPGTSEILERIAASCGVMAGARLSRLGVRLAGGQPKEFVLSFNHLAIDGWSMSTVLDELIDAERMWSGNRIQAPLRSDAEQFLLYQRAHRSSEDWDAVRLPSVASHDPRKPSSRRRVTRQWSPSTLRGVQHAARSAGATLASALHGVTYLAIRSMRNFDAWHLTSVISLRATTSGETIGNFDELVGNCLATRAYSFAPDATETLGEALRTAQDQLHALVDGVSNPEDPAISKTPTSRDGAYRSEIALSVGNYPVNTDLAVGKSTSVERPAAPLGVYFWVDDGLHCEMVAIDAVAPSLTGQLMEKVQRAVEFLPGSIDRPVGHFLSVL